MGLFASRFAIGTARLTAAAPADGALDLPPVGVTPNAIKSPWAPDPSGLSGLIAAELFGTDHLPVTRAAAMSVGAVAKIRTLGAGTIAQFPLVAMTGPERSKQQPIIVSQPEAGRPRSATMTWVVDALMFYGRAWLIVTERYAEDQRPRRLKWCPQWCGDYDDRGNLIKAFDRPVEPRDVVRIDGPHEGLLNFAAPRIREAIAIDRAAALAGANPVASVELHQTGGDPLDDTEIDDLVSGWTDARRTRGVAFSNQSIEVKDHGIAPEQLLIDGRNQAALNLVRALGFPAWAADVPVNGTSLQYSNAPSRSRELTDYALQAYMTPIADRFSMDDILPAGQWARFETGSILRGDFKERMDAYAVAIASGMYTAEQCRLIEAGTPLEEV